jgi:putative oxidoreductase
MTDHLTTPSRHADALALAGRVLIAAIFVLAGANKALNPEMTIGYISSVGLPLPQVAYAGAVGVELLGGIALIIGYRTRTAALALAAFCLVSAAVFHNQIGDQTQFVMFFKNLAMAGGLLFVAAFGPGRFALTR